MNDERKVIKDSKKKESAALYSILNEEIEPLFSEEYIRKCLSE